MIMSIKNASATDRFTIGVSLASSIITIISIWLLQPIVFFISLATAIITWLWLSPNMSQRNPIFARILNIVIIFVVFIGGFASVQLVDVYWLRPTASTNSLAVYSVSAKEPNWTPTGVTIRKGSKIRIRVVDGSWTAYKGGWPMDNGTGVTAECGNVDCPAPHFNTGALAARVGSTNFGVGSDCTFIATADGEVELRINDSVMSENEGKLYTEITSDSQVTTPVSDTCGK